MTARVRPLAMCLLTLALCGGPAASVFAGCATTPPAPANPDAPRFAPQRAGITDTYVITFAAQPDPVVFRNEATLAKTTLVARYGVRDGQSAALTASRGANAATKRGLLASIAAAGAALDPDEDILVVYLSGHGRRGGRLQLVDVDGEKDELTAAELASSLSDANIGTALIVVSACFSGGFVDALAAGERVVLTAARHDRSSFGCKATDRLSFFGDALLTDNLGNDVSLEVAHDSAKDRIRRLEAAKNKPRSFPQRRVGVMGRERLEQARRKHAAKD